MKYTRNIVILSLIVALVLWAAGAMIDTYFLHRGTSPVALLIGTSSHEIYPLLFMIAGFLLYSALLTKAVIKRDPAHETLTDSMVVNDRLRKEIRVRADGRRTAKIGKFFGHHIQQHPRPLQHHGPGLHDHESERFVCTHERPANDLLGKTCYEALHGRTGVCEECVVEKTFRSSDPCAKEKLVTTPDGSELWMEIYTYPVLDENMRVSHVIEYARNITDRKMAEEEKKHLIKKLNHLSTTDSLTGLLNRRALNDILDHEIGRASRYSSDLSLILCDIDRFKLINDSYGHRAGDLALQAIAESLKKTLRKADVIGRYGGDEFMMILPETSLNGAKSLAEKIRAAVENTELELPGKLIGLSMSIGVASCCAAVENSDTIVARADAALYTSKQAGRNSVSIAEL